MNKQDKVKDLSRIGIISAIFLLTFFLCGCSENNDSNDEVISTEFLGTWIGNMNYSMFNFRENFSMLNVTNMTGGENNTITANITELEFTKDIVYMTINTENGTQTIPQTYKIEGDQLVLSFQFEGERPDWMQSPSDIERPPFDGERPPFDGEIPPFDRDRLSRGRSYIYSFSEDYHTLYLNGSQFIKVK